MPEQINSDMEQWGKLAAENYSPEVQAPSWEKIEKVLQKEMPEEKDKRRRLILWLFFLLASLGVGGYLVTRNDKTTPANAATTKTESRPSASSNNAALQQDNKRELKQSKDGISNSLGAITTPVTQPGNKLQGGSRMIKKDTSIRAKSITMYPPLGAASENRNTVASGKKNGKNKPGNNNNDISNDRVVTSAGNTSSVGSNGGDNTAGKPADDRVAVKVGNIDTQKEEEEQSKADTAAAVAKVKDVIADKNKVTAPKQAADTIVKKEDKKKEKITIPGPLEFTALYGSDVSTVKFSNNDKPGTSYGLLVGYHFNNNWSIRTGAIWTRKIYTVNGEDFKVKASAGPYPNTLTSVSGFCDMWDIPLDVKYDFHPDSKWHLFAEGGLSTYLMNKEDYDYSWISSIGVPSNSHSTLNTQRNYLFSIVNLSVGLSTMLSKRLSLQLQPYAKIPLAGVGAGEIHLMSFGAYATLSLRPFNKKSKK